MKRLVACLLLAVVATTCVSRRVDIRRVDIRDPLRVSAAAKAHLRDGSTVVYPEGVIVTSDALEGEGMRYDVALAVGTVVTRVPLADVLAMERYDTRVNVAATAALTTLGGIGAVYGAAALFVVIFGSCPTVYSSDGMVDEAELFSNSIAPLFEAPDVDRLRAQPDATGTLTLDIRNEALETHYINHLELIEVDHAPDEVVVPDPQGSALVLTGISAAAAATARDGRDVRAVLARADDWPYATDRDLLARVDLADMKDWIDVTIPVERAASTVTLVLRARNSLLSTVLLYDVMLAPSGAAALDWLGDGLSEISKILEFGRWYHARAGLHVAVWRDGSFQDVARVPDSGPIAWHDVAVVVPVPPNESTLKLRLSFTADYWRIDRLGLAFSTRPAASRRVPIADVRTSDGGSDAQARAFMQAVDDKYLQTGPGQRFVLRFEVGTQQPGLARTFLLASRGYYTEWIRGSWVRDAAATEPFVPSDDAVITAIRRWRSIRDTFEAQFRAARVPVTR